MATTAKPTTPKVTRPSRARANTAKPAPVVTAAPEPAAPAEVAPKLEETTVVVEAPAPVVTTTSAVMTPDGALERKEGYVLEPMTPSKNFARFKVPEGIGCVPSTIYAPPDTVTVKILLVRKA